MPRQPRLDAPGILHHVRVRGLERHRIFRAMWRLLRGYAGAFDRRHKRAGHLFRNRYKSIVVEEESYLLEVVRYLRLHPLRAGVGADLRALEGYAWSGHRGLLGTVPRAWQATGEILRRFARGLPGR